MVSASITDIRSAPSCTTILMQPQFSMLPARTQPLSRSPSSCYAAHTGLPAVSAAQRCRSSAAWPCVHRHLAARAAAEDSPSSSMESAFLAELNKRQEQQAAQAEQTAAAAFDGQALLRLLQNKYGRSYDLSLVKREYMGKLFVAMNVMWRYREQRSFGYTEQEYMERLDMFARVLVAWGVVGAFSDQLAATKERPRVGKAVSIMLDVPADRVAEWLG